MSGAENKSCSWHVFVDEQALLKKAYKDLVDYAADAIQKRGQFHLVLAGGSTPRKLHKMLCDLKTDWSCWHIYWGDERCLPINDPERNSLMACQDWLDHVPIPANQIHLIPAEKGATQATEFYNQLLKDVGDFDLVMLGMGEDGHTASLFPGKDLGDRADSPDVLAVSGAPKPPPDRVSMSVQRLSRAAHVMIMITGESKREVVKRWRSGERLPVNRISPASCANVLVVGSLLG